MKKFEIIKKNIEFQRVFEKGHSIFSRYLVVYFLPNSLTNFRCGFCAGKKLGSAVIRNHVKRILREAVHLAEEEAPSNLDVVIIAKNRILDVGLQQMVVEINRLFVQLRKEALKKEGETEDSQ